MALGKKLRKIRNHGKIFALRFDYPIRIWSEFENIKMKFALGKKLRKIRSPGNISVYALTIQYEFGDEIVLRKKLRKIHGKISVYILTIQYEFGINLKILR